MRASAGTSRGALPDGEYPTSRPMLTRDDTAAYLAVSKRTLDRLVQAGEIPAYRIGGHRRFRIEDIDSFVASKME
jgi:excisionase family DNA binding protein